MAGSYRLVSGVTIPNEWAQYATQQVGDFEIIHRPLWDTKTFNGSLTQNLLFFNSAQASLDVGNEVVPLKNSFLIAAIGLYFKDNPQEDVLSTSAGTPNSRLMDHVLVVNTGVLAINIGSKDYGPFPMWKLSAGGGFSIMQTSGTPYGFSQLGQPDPRAMFKLAVPIVLPQGSKATIGMQWGATIATSILTAPVSLCLTF